MTTKKYNWAILGPGKIAHTFVNDLNYFQMQISMLLAQEILTAQGTFQNNIISKGLWIL